MHMCTHAHTHTHTHTHTHAHPPTHTHTHTRTQRKFSTLKIAAHFNFPAHFNLLLVRTLFVTMCVFMKAIIIVCISDLQALCDLLNAPSSCVITLDTKSEIDV